LITIRVVGYSRRSIMIHRTCATLSDWVQTTNASLSLAVGEAFADQSRPVVFLPAGETPRPLYEDWRRAPPYWLRSVDLFQIDEILNERQPFAEFFRIELPSVTVRNPGLGAHVPHLAVLGLGTNGHVGFHEPHVALDFFSGCVRLDDETTQRLSVPRGAWGVTYGVDAIRRSKTVLLLVRGSKKQAILERVLSGDPKLPAAAFLNHPGFQVINLPIDLPID
jgi:6-phosphogluconolactonase/glucosamine-6-phosphate isomerase/deaminase